MNLYADYKIHVFFVFLEITTVLNHSRHMIYFYVSNKIKHLLPSNGLTTFCSLQKSHASSSQCFVHGIPCTWKLPYPLSLQIQILNTLINLPISSLISHL